MAKKYIKALDRDESTAHSEAGNAMRDWHADREGWSDRAFKAVMLVNAGGAVAAAAFIGTFFGASGYAAIAPPNSLYSLGSFIIGLVLPLIYMMYRFAWAEYRVWYLRSKRRDLNDPDKQVDPHKIMTKRPPTRFQLAFIYICNIGSLVCFLVGCWMGMMSLGAF